MSANTTFSLTVFQASSWSNSWNTITRSGPGRDDLAAIERDAALGRADVAADRLEQGRLAAAGRPEQHVTVGALDREVDAVGRGDEGMRRLVLQGHAVDLEEWHPRRGVPG